MEPPVSRVEVIEEVAAMLERRAGKSPCGCAELSEEGYWWSNCTCGNYDDCASVASWCGEMNAVVDVRRMGQADGR